MTVTDMIAKGKNDTEPETSSGFNYTWPLINTGLVILSLVLTLNNKDSYETFNIELSNRISENDTRIKELQNE